MYKRLLIVVSGLLFGTVGLAAKPPSLNQLLDAMGQSLAKRNYVVSYVLVHEGRLDTIKYSHLATPAGAVFERIEQLNGPRKLYLQMGGEAFLVVGNKVFALEGEDETPAARWQRQMMRLSRSRDDYQIGYAGTTRVAGRLSHQIIFSPRNKDRLGTHLWLDADSSVPLGVASFTPEGQITQQLMAVDFEAAPTLSTRDFMLPPGAHMERGVLTSVSVSENRECPWQVGWVPRGYELARLRGMASRHGTRWHWLYSDGLTVMSVFVEPNDGQETGMHALERGDALIFDVAKPSTRVTVVGSVPRRIAEKVAASVSSASPVKSPAGQ
jgi:sigma-E factor negative regulatory protein RseB